MIGPNHVVSAAQCIIWDSPSEVIDVAGEHDESVDGELASPVKCHVVEAGSAFWLEDESPPSVPDFWCWIAGMKR